PGPAAPAALPIFAAASHSALFFGVGGRTCGCAGTGAVGSGTVGDGAVGVTGAGAPGDKPENQSVSLSNGDLPGSFSVSPFSSPSENFLYTSVRRSLPMTVARNVRN